MSYRNNGFGCSGLLVLIAVLSVIIVLVVKGVAGLVDNIDRHSSHTHTQSSSQKNDHVWGENGIDPVLRTSTGGMYKDPEHPDDYFDVRTTCEKCGGKGKISSYEAGKGRVEIKCKDCYGTGHKRRPISQMPKGTVPNEKID